MTGVLCGASPLVKIFNVADTAVDRGVSGEPAPDIISDVLCGYLWMNFRDARASISSSYAARGRCRTGGFGCGSSAACVDAATRPHSSTSACTAIATATAAANKSSLLSVQQWYFSCVAASGARERTTRARSSSSTTRAVSASRSACERCCVLRLRRAAGGGAEPQRVGARACAVPCA